jgi:hypothetical protein
VSPTTGKILVTPLLRMCLVLSEKSVRFNLIENAQCFAILIIGSWLLCKRNYMRNSILHRNFSSVIQQFFHSLKFFLSVTMENKGFNVIYFASKTNFRQSKPEILLIFLYFLIKLKQVQFNSFTSSSRRIYISNNLCEQQIEFPDHLFVIVKALLIFLKIIKSSHMIFIQSQLNQPFIQIKGGVVTKIEFFP